MPPHKLASLVVEVVKSPPFEIPPKEKLVDMVNEIIEKARNDLVE